MTEKTQGQLSPSSRQITIGLIDQIVGRLEFELFGSPGLDRKNLFLLPFILHADSKTRGDALILFRIFNKHAIFKDKFHFIPAGIEKIDHNKSWKDAAHLLEKIKDELWGIAAESNGLFFEYSTGKLKLGAVVKHAFQTRHGGEIGTRKLSKAGRLFFQLFAKRTVVDVKTKSERKIGESQSEENLISLLNAKNREELRNLINSIEKLIKDKELKIKLLKSKENNRRMLLLSEEV